MIGTNDKMSISLRFNSFSDALDAHLCLSNYSYTAPSGQKGSIRSNFFEPAPLYFDGKFSTKFEGCIKDKFTGLETVNEISSDYVKRGLIERGLQPINRFADRLNPNLKL